MVHIYLTLLLLEACTRSMVTATTFLAHSTFLRDKLRLAESDSSFSDGLHNMIKHAGEQPMTEVDAIPPQFVLPKVMWLNIAHKIDAMDFVALGHPTCNRIIKEVTSFFINIFSRRYFKPHYLNKVRSCLMQHNCQLRCRPLKHSIVTTVPAPASIGHIIASNRYH